MKYVSPEYQAQLDHLAETLVTPERFNKQRDLGQLALFDIERAEQPTEELEPLPDNVVPLRREYGPIIA